MKVSFYFCKFFFWGGEEGGIGHISSCWGKIDFPLGSWGFLVAWVATNNQRQDHDFHCRSFCNQGSWEFKQQNRKTPIMPIILLSERFLSWFFMGYVAKRFVFCKRLDYDFASENYFSNHQVVVQSILVFGCVLRPFWSSWCACSNLDLAVSFIVPLRGSSFPQCTPGWLKLATKS